MIARTPSKRWLSAGITLWNFTAGRAKPKVGEREKEQRSSFNFRGEPALKKKKVLL